MKLLSIAVLLLVGCVSMRPASAIGNITAPSIWKHCTAAHVPCVLYVTDDAHWRATTLISVPAKTMPWQGNTIATIAAQFPVVINWEWQTETPAQLNAQMAVFKDLELARFSHQYWVESHGDLSTLMYYAGLKLTAANLVRLRAAFGTAVDVGALNAPAAIQTQYRALAKRVPIKQSHAAYVAAGKLSRTLNAMATGVAAPTVEMTPYEIYNEFLWTSAETELGALAAMAKFMTVQVQVAAIIGWKVGGTFYHFAETIDPNYGYDVVTLYGDIGAADFGPIDSGVTGHGEVGEITVIETDSWCEDSEPC